MEGSGLNLTVMSYLDSVDFGFLVDSELIPDVWDLAAAAEEAFKELKRAARRYAARVSKIEPPKANGSAKSTSTKKRTTKKKPRTARATKKKTTKTRKSTSKSRTTRTRRAKR